VGDERLRRHRYRLGRPDGVRDVLRKLDAGIDDVSQGSGLGVVTGNRGCGWDCDCGWLLGVYRLRPEGAGLVCCESASCCKSYDQEPDRE
jgi:hypothetical protein